MVRQAHHRDVDAEDPLLPLFDEHPLLEVERLGKAFQSAEVVLQLHRATARPQTLSLNANREGIPSNGEATLFPGRYRMLVVLVQHAEGFVWNFGELSPMSATKRTQIGRRSATWEDGTRVAMDHSW